MDNKLRISGISALLWAALTFLALAALIIASTARGSDLYDISRGIRDIGEISFPIAGAYLSFSWSGAALIFLVVAINSWLPAESQSYLLRVGGAFGLIAGALFIIYGLVGGHGYLDLSYVQSVRSVDYIREAYLPFTIVSTQLLGAAITVSGLWLILTNWHFVRSTHFSPYIAYLGITGGAFAILGFIMPAGLFGAFGLLVAIFWGTLVGVQLLRTRALAANTSLT